jgi:serine protease Do
MADRPARNLQSRCRTVCLAVFTLCLVTLCAPVRSSELRQTPVVKAILVARPSIVNIRGEKTLSGVGAASPADNSRRVNGMGTGVVIDPRGYIVTNYHVVDGVREIQVTLASEEKFIARLVDRDAETDLAVIKIDAKRNLPVINIGTSSDLMTGESVIAVGNAYGYEHTVTRGIISALHRAVQVSDAQYYDDLIQTDASINPGNSGGPLLNIDGEMIGINVAVRAGAQGIGFAIPVDKVMAVVSDLIAGTNAKRAYHGLVLTKSKSGDKTVVVGAVEPDSPASKAGLKPGDVIRSVGDVQVTRALDFHRGVLEHAAGDQVKLSVQRKDEKLTLDLTLASASSVAASNSNSTWTVLGLELRPIPAEEFRETYQTRYRGGLLVTNVRADSPAANQGIHRGDVLVGMHIWETISQANVEYILTRPDVQNLTPLKFFILRGGETLYGYMPLAMKGGTETR